MSTRLVRVLLTAGILIASLGLLMYTTMKDGAEYYVHVDEVMASPQDWYGKPLQLHGYVVDGSVEVNTTTLDYRFKIENNDAVVNASYTGVVPDTFKGGSEVVLRGRLASDGFHVQRDGVMAKCPSKYQPATTVGGQ